MNIGLAVFQTEAAKSSCYDHSTTYWTCQYFLEHLSSGSVQWSFSAASSSLYKEPAMFHHCNDPIRFGHFEHLELPRCCIVTWHFLAANSKLVETFESSSEYSLWCWQQRKIVGEYWQLACEWFLPWQEIRLYSAIASMILNDTQWKIKFDSKWSPRPSNTWK